MHFVGLAATQAEAELAGYEPVFAAAVPLKALGADMDVLGHIFAEGAFDLRLGLAKVQPGLGQVFDAVPVALAKLGGAQKAIAGVFVVVAGDVVNLSRGVFDLPLARAPHRVVFLTAVPAKMHRVQLRALVLAAGGKALGVQRDVAHAFGFQRGQHLARAADELVQLECKGCASLGGFDIVRGHQKTLQPGAGLLQRALGINSEPAGSVVQGNGFGTARRLIRGQFDAQDQLHPHRQRVVAEGGKVWPVVTALLQCLFQHRHDGVNVFARVGDPLQGFANHVLLGDLRAKQQAGNTGDGLISVCQRARGRHGGGRANAHQLVGLQTLAQTAHQQGYVGALASPVGVQLIQHQEFQTLAMLDHPPIHVLIAGQNQLQHHEVGQQDVGRVVGYLVALSLAFLARVARYGKGGLALWITMQELVQLLQLAVGQGIHGVDDDGARALLRIDFLGFQNAVNDGHEERQRFAGAGSGGHHVALVFLRLGQRLQLVDIQVQVRRLPLGLTRTEKVCAMSVQNPLLRQLLDSALPLVVGVDLDQRLGPITATVILVLNLGKDVLGRNLGEASRKCAVFADELVAKIKDVVHFFLCPNALVKNF